MFKKFRQRLSQKTEVNYLYFSILFIVLSIFSLFHVCFLEKPLWGIRLFFLIYSVGQALLEIWAFIFIAYSLKRWAPRWAFFSFIALSFILLLVHFTDFTLLRLMDASISYLFKFLFGRGFEHLLTAFLALNMNLGMIAIIILSIVVIPFIGVLLYWATSHIAKMKPWSLSHNQIALAIIATGGSLLFLELLAHPYLDRLIYHKFQKTLPLGTTFLSPTPQCIHLPHPIANFRDEKETRKRMPYLMAQQKPNIYLFVIETLRRDFVDEKTAPNLTAFAQQHIDFPSSFANANWTPLSWFAIFHSDFPYDWAAMRDHWKGGSIPLQLFKQLGYKIRVYSSADLSYFGMDKAIFGEKRKLADSIEEFSFDRTIEPCDRDALCIDSFKKDLASKGGREGNLYIFFFDATHSEYSYPKNFPLKFQPSAKQIDYLTLTQKEIEPVKNRYRNAIAFVDSLFGNFFDTLKQENLYEEAVIAITGDHGEEFYEEGALFHGSHLNRYQTQVPIFCKFPGRTSASKEATHIDLFPSLLHHITGTSYFGDLFDGASIFTNNQCPFRLAVLQNGPDTPIEFSISQGDNRLQLRFLNPKDIYKQTQLEIISLKISEELPGESLETNIEHAFPRALNPLLKKGAR